MAASPVTLVVPLFNESARWDDAYWEELTTIEGVSWLFVDDGSSDSTTALVQQFTKSPNTGLLKLSRNLGKANAVRAGLRQALETGSLGVGFIDGDGAFTRVDIEKIVSTFIERCGRAAQQQTEESTWDSVWASRVALAGHQIDRKLSRHYVGRIIATIISPGLPNVPYDTQCGFKIFRSSAELTACLTEPFTTRWFFDVEVLQRWIANTGRPMKVWEVPLLHWRDVPGSKITSRNTTQIARELATISLRNRRLAK